MTYSDYYSLLGVSSSASLDEVKSAFHDLCRQLHPDKQRDESSNLELEKEKWQAVQTAWRCLSNETRRVVYDIRREGRTVTQDDCTRLLQLQMGQAARDIENMRFQFAKAVEFETRNKGIIILKALFGDLLDGQTIDVTVPLQCAVDAHKLILPAGIAKADLPGFYNPIPLLESNTKACALYVLYDFKGKRHEITIGENDALWLPLKNHLLPPEAAPNGPDRELLHILLNAKLAQVQQSLNAQQPPSASSAGGGAFVFIATTTAALLTLWFLNSRPVSRAV